jgi:hypothetical protein
MAIVFQLIMNRTLYPYIVSIKRINISSEALYNQIVKALKEIIQKMETEEQVHDHSVTFGYFEMWNINMTFLVN